LELARAGYVHKMRAFLRVTKKLICPQCGDVLADADYRPLVGSLALTAPGGDQLTPQMGAVHLRRAEEQLATADSAVAADEARTRLEFVQSHIGELIYDLPCHRGHYILATAPQMTRSLRRTRGGWVSPRPG
jgi:hypothetical protein